MKKLTEQWLNFAENDFTSATLLLKEDNERVFGTVCFSCQQCIEKLMKAILIESDLESPKVHDLKHLAKLIAPVFPSFEAKPKDLRFLTDAFIEFRYPGEMAERQEAEKAMGICTDLRVKLLEYFGKD